MSVPALWVKHRGLARAIARDFFFPGASREDVTQEAEIGLWIACRRYDQSLGPFPPFARKVVTRRLSTLLRAALAHKHEPLTLSVRHTVDEDGVSEAVIDSLPDRNDVERIVVARETLDELVVAVGNLPRLQRDALASVVNGVPYVGDKRTDNAVFRARRALKETV